MPYGTSAFFHLMDSWLSDSRFQKLNRYGQRRHWLQATSLRETNHSDILAWLLNPLEGHGLGETFICRFLTAAMTAEPNVEIVDKLLKSESWPRLSDLLQRNFRNFAISREVYCGKVKIGKRQERGLIDLLLVDPAQKLIVLIERKANRIAHEAQLEKYETWLRDKYAGYMMLRVVSDEGGARQLAAQRRGWLVLDDDWLVTAIQEVIQQDQLPEHVSHALRAYLDYLDWDENRDHFYHGIADELDAFAEARAKEVQDLRQMKIYGFEAKSITASTINELFLPRLRSSKIQVLNKELIERAGMLAARHNSVFDAILDRATFNSIEKSIEGAYPDAFAAFHKRRRSGQPELWMTLKRYEDYEYWPLTLELVQIRSDEDAQQMSLRVRLRIHCEAFNEFEQMSNVAEAVLDKFKKRRTSYANVTLQVKNYDVKEFEFPERAMWLTALMSLEDVISNALATSAEEQ